MSAGWREMRENGQGWETTRLRCVMAGLRVEVVQMGREELIQKPLWRTSKFPGCSSEKVNLKQNLGRGRGWGKLQPFWPVACSTAAPAWRWAFWLCAERSDYIPKTWPQRVPFEDPWDTAVNQQTGHQGSLDILKCVLDTWASVLVHSFSLPMELEQPVASGTCQALPPHMELLYLGARARAHRAGLYPAVWLRGGGNWKHQDDVDYEPENQTCWEPEDQ